MKINNPIESCLKELGRYVVPICVRNGGSKTPHFLGSGIPVLFKEGLYLVTAAHVVDDAGDDQILIAGNSTFLTVGGPIARWSYMPGSSPDYDLAVYGLLPEHKLALEPFYRFVSETDISTVSEYNKFILYAFVGYPHSKNKPRPTSVSNMIECRPFYYVAREFANLANVNSSDKTEATHIAFRAPLKKSVDLNQNLRLPPNPQGISGCPVWKLDINAKTGMVTSAQVIGVGIEYHQSKEALIATKSNFMLSAITQLQSNLLLHQDGKQP